MNYLIRFAVVAIFAAAIWLTVFAADTCAEAGGHLEVSHYQPMWLDGKNMSLMPVYECRGAR